MCVEKTNGPVAKLKFDPPQFLETNRQFKYYQMKESRKNVRRKYDVCDTKDIS